MSNEIHAIVTYPDKFWNLSMNAYGKIEKASFFVSLYQYLLSFFSDSLPKSLCTRLKEILQAEVSNEEKVILSEKIGVLRKTKNVWFQQIPTLSSQVNEIVTHSEKMVFSGQLEPVKIGRRYYNYPEESIWNKFWETQKLLFVGAFDPPTYINDLNCAFRVEWRPKARNWKGCDIIWLGHATILLQVVGLNLLFDPSFGFVFPCFMRHTLPGIPLESMPLIDFLLISHNHDDHVNKLEHFARCHHPVIFEGTGSQKWLEGMGFRHVVENDWWQQTTIVREEQSIPKTLQKLAFGQFQSFRNSAILSNPILIIWGHLRSSNFGALELPKCQLLKCFGYITVTFVPAVHGSQLGLMDANQMLWGGYVVQALGKTFYFAGDTGKNKKLFPQIKEQFE